MVKQCFLDAGQREGGKRRGGARVGRVKIKKKGGSGRQSEWERLVPPAAAAASPALSGGSLGSGGIKKTTVCRVKRGRGKGQTEGGNHTLFDELDNAGGVCVWGERHDRAVCVCVCVCW